MRAEVPEAPEAVIRSCPLESPEARLPGVDELTEGLLPFARDWARPAAHRTLLVQGSSADLEAQPARGREAVVLLYSDHSSTSADKFISFEEQGNPVSANNGFVEACTAGQAGGKSFARPLGREELTGTGFDDPGNSAATGWLRTNSTIVPGETFKLRFAVWDMGDEVLDTTVLLDRFVWVPDAGKASSGSERPPVCY